MQDVSWSICKVIMMHMTLKHDTCPLIRCLFFAFPSILVPFQKFSFFCDELFNIQPSTMVVMMLMAVLLCVPIIHTFVHLIRPMNSINPPQGAKTPVEKLMMPIMESNPPTHERNKCIPRVHCRRFNQLERHENPKCHDMRM